MRTVNDLAYQKDKATMQPYLGSMIIRTSNQIRFITTSEIIHTINSFEVSIQCEVWIRGTKIPDLLQE